MISQENKSSSDDRQKKISYPYKIKPGIPMPYRVESKDQVFNAKLTTVAQLRFYSVQLFIQLSAALVKVRPSLESTFQLPLSWLILMSYFLPEILKEMKSLDKDHGVVFTYAWRQLTKLLIQMPKSLSVCVHLLLLLLQIMQRKP